MLHEPQHVTDFAKYTTKRANETLLGYEYEIDWPDCGPPGAVTKGHWHQVGDDYDPYSVKLPTKSKVTEKKNPIRDLPNYFHVSYECLGQNDGYEIKSVIAPLCIHKQLIKKILFRGVTFNNHPNGSRNEGGIHVSINVDDRTQAMKEKVFTFVHSLPRATLKALSERTWETLNQFACSTMCQTEEARWGNHLEEVSWENHYAVINHENYDRYEFRLFAAQKHLLIPAIEMADSLFDAAEKIEELTFESWERFIRSKLKYAEISKHVREKLH